MIDREVKFRALASTGRTATSFLAQAFDQLVGVAGCHEGHRANDDGVDLLPMINLDNFAAYKSAKAATEIVAAKRGRAALAHASALSDCDVIIDVAYYNAVIATALLDHHPNMSLVGVIRDCEGFVRSVTWLRGEDPMPVGWPAPDKELSAREMFIGMGRIRPLDDEAAAQWTAWGPIERNIWLWSATNHRLLDARDAHPDRVAILDFADLRTDPLGFLRSVCSHLDLHAQPADNNTWADIVASSRSRRNERRGGYQIEPSPSWTSSERAMLERATGEINERLVHGPN